MTLKNKVAIITGGGDGLGEAIAYKLASQGARLWLLARGEVGLEKVVKTIRKEGGQADYVLCDITSEQMVQKCFAHICRETEKVDILINNAGIWLQGETVKASPREVRQVIDTNLLGTIYSTQAALPAMLEQNSGHILNIISTAGVEPNGLWTIYTASKYGVRGFTDSLKLEMAGTGIKVTGLYPDGLSTNLFIKAGVDAPPGQPWMMNTRPIADLVAQVLIQPEEIVVDHIEIRKG